MITFSEAVERCLSGAKSLPREKISLIDSLGRVLREDVHTPYAIPPFTRSAMDGYAVRSQDIAGASRERPVILDVIGDLPAGRQIRKKIKQGKTIRIMTGAPLPEGSDAVVMVEDTEKKKNRVHIYHGVKKHENVAFAGEDVKKGERILAKGTFIGPAEMGMLAACGKAQVYVSKRPKIGVLSTGDEVVVPGTPRKAYQIYDANGFSLAGLAKKSGAEVTILGIIRDRYEDLLQILEQVADFDIVVLSGGISVGDYDIVQDALLRAGIQKVFWKVKIQPGKPIFLGRRAGQLLFALPGNPVSAMVNFLLFVRPVLDKMMGRQSVGLRKGDARILDERRIKPGRRKFLRARLEWHHGIPGVRILPYQASGVLRSMVEADVLVDVPDEVECLRQGDIVTILYLDY